MTKTNKTEKSNTSHWTSTFVITCLLLLSGVISIQAQTIWSAGSLTFTESSLGQQDNISGQTALTRNTVLYNAICQTVSGSQGCSYAGPCNTQWAVGTIANWNSLTYSNFYQANGCSPTSGLPKTYVCHLITENIYLQVTFTSWQAGGVGMSYTRTTGPACPLSISCSGTNISCFGGSNGAASVAVNNGTAPISYLWSNSYTSSSITGLTAGVYTVTVTDACASASCSVVVSQPNAALSASAISTSASCPLCPDGSVSISSVSGGTPGYTYTNLTGLLPGNYCITVTDANGCTTSACATVGAAGCTMIASTTLNHGTSCFGVNNGSATVTPTGGVIGPYSYQWDNGITSATANNLSAGNHTIVVTDFGTGCVSQGNINVTQPSALSASCGGTNISCNGGSNGTASVTASGGTPGYTYLWSNGNTNSSLSGLPAGTYCVTVADANGCTATCCYTVTQPPVTFSIACSGTNVSCNGGNNGTASVSVTNLNTPSTQTTTFPGSPFNSYGPLATVSTISVPALPPLSVVTSATLTLNSINSINGSWRSEVRAALSGAYTLAATQVSTLGSGGLISPDPVITLAGFPAAGGSVNLDFSESYDDGGSGVIDATIGGASIAVSYVTGQTFTYAWSNGATTASVSNLTAGTYTVIVTNNTGCTSSCVYEVTQPTPLVATCSGTNVSCNGGTNGTAAIAASGGNGGSANYTVTNSFSGSPYNSYGPLTTVSSLTLPVLPAGAVVTSASLTINNINSINGSYRSEFRASLSGAYTLAATQVSTLTSGGLITPDPVIPLAGFPTTGGVVNLDLSETYDDGGSGVIDATVGGASITINYTLNGYTYLWSNGNTNSSLSGLPAGTYCVTVADANGCTATCCYTVTQPPVTFSIACSGTNVSCNGGNNGTASVSVTNLNTPSTQTTTFPGSPFNSYGPLATVSTISVPALPPLSVVTSATLTLNSINSINGSWRSEVRAALSGAYTLAATQVSTLGSGGLISPDPVITLAGFPAAGGSVNLDFSESYDDGGSGVIDATIGGASIAVSYVTGQTFTYAWSNGATTASVSNLTAGTYTVIVTNNTGCTSSCVYEVTQPTPLVATCSGTNVSCNGGTNGTAAIAASGGNGGSANYTVTNSFSGSPYNSYGPLTTVSSLTLPVLPAGAVVTSASLTINNINSINGSYRSEFRASLSGAYTLAATQVSTLTSGGLITPDPVIPLAGFPTTGGVVNLDLSETYDDGGSGVIDATVGGASITINYTLNGYTYLWSNGNTNSSLSGLPAGTYCVTVADANGCTATCCYTVTQPTALSLIYTGTNVSCYGGNNGSMAAVASGGTGAYTYSPSASLGNLTAGTYCITVTDSNGCTASICYTVTQPNPVVVTCSGSDVTTNGGSNGTLSAVASGGTGGFTYSPSSSLTGLVTGTYCITATDVNGCSSSCCYTVTQPNTPLTINCSGTNVSCNGGNNGSVSAIASGGGGNYTYSPASTIGNLTAGTYCIIVTDGNGSTTSCCYTITQPTALTISCSGTNVSCNGGNNGSLSAFASGGTGPYTYSPYSSIGNLTAGNYCITVTDANGCTASCCYTVTEPTALTISCSGNNVSCNGGNNGNMSAVASGGTGAYTYSPASSLGNLAAGTYCITVTDANGCTSSCCYTVTEPAPLALNPIVHNVTCKSAKNGTINLFPYGGTPGYVYNWSGSTSTGSSRSNLAPGTYCVTVTDANGCNASACYVITQPATSMVLNTSKTNVRCGGYCTGVATVSPTGGCLPYSYLWNTGSNAASIGNLCAGTYTCVVTDACGCVKVATIVITQTPALVVVALPSTPSSASANVSGGTAPYSYKWNTMPNQTTATATGLTPGSSYKIRVTDSKNCSQTSVVNMPLPKINGVASSDKFEVTVYPNPTDGIVTLNFSTLESFNYTMKLFDLTGRVVYNSSKVKESGNSSQVFDFSYLPKGVYQLNVQSDKGTAVIKIGIQ